MQWPAIIKLHGEDELIFIAGMASFASDTQLQTMHFQPHDLLIDSAGNTYKPVQSHPVTLARSENVLSLDDVLVLLRAHLANDGSCCVSKFYAHTIAEAYAAAFA